MISILNIYSAFSENAFKERYAYRFASFIWSLSMIFNMLIQYFIWCAIYSETDGFFLGVSESSYIVYIAIGAIFYAVIGCSSNMDIASEVQSGDIAMNLIKPFNYKFMCFFRHVGARIADIIGLIPVFIAIIFFVGDFKIDALTFLLFIFSSVLAFFVSFLFCYVAGMVAFWTVNYWGVHMCITNLSGIFSGQLMALNFYTDVGKLQDSSVMYTFLSSPVVVTLFQVVGILAYCLPFQSMFYTPMSIFSGIITSPESIAIHIGIQVFWIVFLNFLSHWIWKQAQKKITIFGG